MLISKLKQLLKDWSFVFIQFIANNVNEEMKLLSLCKQYCEIELPFTVTMEVYPAIMIVLFEENVIEEIAISNWLNENGMFNF